REPYEQLSLIRVFQDRRNALNRKVGNLPEFLEVGHGKRRNDMTVAERFGHEERLSIAGENHSGGAWRRIGTQRVEISIQQKNLRGARRAKNDGEKALIGIDGRYGDR